MASVVTIRRNDFAVSGSESGLRKVAVQAAVKVHAQAVALAPVDFGQLRNSIMYILDDGTNGGFNSQPGDKAPESQKLPKPDSRTLAIVGTNSDHWYPEFGTRNQVAQPFLRPAGEIVAKGGDAQQIALKYGREAMEEEFRKRKQTVRTFNA